MKEEDEWLDRRKNQKQMLEEMKNTVTEIKNVFDGLISRLDTLRNEYLSLRI